ncbi:hypothetical protein ADN00_06570, partial [Ornatilinea apprima]
SSSRTTFALNSAVNFLRSPILDLFLESYSTPLGGVQFLGSITGVSQPQISVGLHTMQLSLLHPFPGLPAGEEVDAAGGWGLTTADFDPFPGLPAGEGVGAAGGWGLTTADFDRAAWYAALFASPLPWLSCRGRGRRSRGMGSQTTGFRQK